MLEKFQEIVREAKGDKSIVVEPEMALLSDLKLDSFDVAGIVNEIETEFDIKVNDRDINTLKTVQNVLDYINEKQAAKK
ncbi:MAG: phosphopantetheine-binding protein [Chitinivibrionia bacterium]|nr:phosphopantetheine-binding protein [Chitinivibrionia bacterium]